MFVRVIELGEALQCSQAVSPSRRTSELSSCAWVSIHAARTGISDDALLVRARPCGKEMPEATHVTPTGGENAQQFPYIPPRFSKVLCDMWRKVRADPLPLLANSPLLQEMRRPLQSAAKGRSRMASLVASGLVYRAGARACAHGTTAPAG